MTTLIFIRSGQVDSQQFSHGEELPPDLLPREVVDHWLDQRWLAEMDGADRRSLYRLFAPFSGAKEKEELTKRRKGEPMFVKLHLPTMINGRIQTNPVIALSEATASRLIKAGVAEPDPYLEQMKEKARRLGQNVDWAEQERFKRPRAGVIAGFQAEESFGEKLRRAVERRAAQRGDSVQQANERAERERNRYRKRGPRPRTKGE